MRLVRGTGARTRRVVDSSHLLEEPIPRGVRRVISAHDRRGLVSRVVPERPARRGCAGPGKEVATVRLEQHVASCRGDPLELGRGLVPKPLGSVSCQCLIVKIDANVRTRVIRRAHSRVGGVKSVEARDFRSCCAGEIVGMEVVERLIRRHDVEREKSPQRSCPEPCQPGVSDSERQTIEHALSSLRSPLTRL